MVLHETLKEGIRILKIDHVNLDWGTSEKIESQMLSPESASVPTIVDLSPVKFADSMGIGLLYRCAGHAMPSLFVLAGVGYRLSRCFERMPAYRSLPIAETVESAFQVAHWQVSASISIETRRDPHAENEESNDPVVDEVIISADIDAGNVRVEVDKNLAVDEAASILADISDLGLSSVEGDTS
ncbi:MAG: STAS domain-containing protein [Planctomycetota bacterium]